MPLTSEIHTMADKLYEVQVYILVSAANGEQAMEQVARELESITAAEVSVEYADEISLN